MANNKKINNKYLNFFQVIQSLFVSANFKFTLFICFCVLIHTGIAVFSILNHIYPLFKFNIASIFVYLILTLLTKMNKELSVYLGYFEILLHSVLCVILIGDDFGFSLYFLAVIPICYNLLHACKSKHNLLKGSFLAFLSFVLYVICYFLSSVNEPMYYSSELAKAKPYVFMMNMFIAFAAVSVFTVISLVEASMAFNRLYSQNQELGVLANHDPLTGLFNRRTMTNHVESMFEKSQATEIPFSLIICDIDDFKKINDTYGHDCGDAVLKKIAATLNALTRGDDFLCRWGGEEFLVLLHGQDINMAHIIAERIRESISNLCISYNNIHDIHITMTFGVSTSSEADQYDILFKLADERLYKGKQNGKNCVV